VPAQNPPRPVGDEALLATWKQLLDNGPMQDCEPHLAGTARPAVARISIGTARAIGLDDSALLTVTGEQGEITLLAEFADLPDGVVWLPSESGQSEVRRKLGRGHGAIVSLARANGGSHA
jgi:NADH-quinone oxidoreductase subunit G